MGNCSARAKTTSTRSHKPGTPGLASSSYLPAGRLLARADPCNLVVVGIRRLAHQVVVGQVAAHPRAHHQRGRHADRARDFGQIVPQITADPGAWLCPASRVGASMTTSALSAPWLQERICIVRTFFGRSILISIRAAVPVERYISSNCSNRACAAGTVVLRRTWGRAKHLRHEQKTEPAYIHVRLLCNGLEFGSGSCLNGKYNYFAKTGQPNGLFAPTAARVIIQ